MVACNTRKKIPEIIIRRRCKNNVREEKKTPLRTSKEQFGIETSIQEHLMKLVVRCQQHITLERAEHPGQYTNHQIERAFSPFQVYSLAFSTC